MLENFTAISPEIIAFLGVLCAFIGTFAVTAGLKEKLPHDQGRQFAHDGALSAGKPRGAGIIFVLVFAVCGLLFANIKSPELVIYIVLVIVEMFTGYFDDAAEKPWGEYLKGALDLVVAIIVAVAFLHYNTNDITIALTGTHFYINPIVFGILTVVLVWASINVTNCSDGVDSLSATLTIITLATFIGIDKLMATSSEFDYLIVLFIVCLIAYLWFNATPSILLMGDAGSRAMGLFIAIAALKSHSPFIYLLAAAVLIVDGGLGLVKVSLIRFLKIHIMKNTTTPIHDHVRKKIGWSNAQVVFRFAIIQAMISLAVLYLIRL